MSAVCSLGGEGAIGAAVGCVVVIVFMAFGMVALQWAAKTMPHLLQGMGLMIYSAQLVLLLVFILSIRNTSLFNLRAFALSLVVAVITWITVQTVRHARSKTLYVDPDADTRNRPGGAGGDRDE